MKPSLTPQTKLPVHLCCPRVGNPIGTGRLCGHRTCYSNFRARRLNPLTFIPPPSYISSILRTCAFSSWLQSSFLVSSQNTGMFSILASPWALRTFVMLNNYLPIHSKYTHEDLVKNLAVRDRYSSFISRLHTNCLQLSDYRYNFTPTPTRSASVSAPIKNSLPGTISAGLFLKAKARRIRQSGSRVVFKTTTIVRKAL